MAVLAVMGCSVDEGRDPNLLPTGVSVSASASGTGDGSGESGPPPGGAESGSGLDCATDGDCPDGERCTEISQTCLPPDRCVEPGDCTGDGFTCEGGVCTIGGDCGGFQFAIESIPPNVMILLDRSGSMSGDVDGTGDNRWEVAQQVITQVTSAFDDRVRFGLGTYSSCTGAGCSAGSIVVPLLPQNAGNIQTFLGMTKGAGSLDGQAIDFDGRIRYLCDSGWPETSTGVSLTALVGEPSLQDTERENAVLLITDGGESSECTGSVNGPGGASMLFAQDPPVLTFAVGFVGASGGQLDQIAVAGGTGQSYFANNLPELQGALELILSTIASCTFTLDQVPPDAAQIYVFFDKDPAGVPVDPANGWTYDPTTNTVTFHGTACTSIKDGVITDIDIVYGCNYPPAG